MKSVIYGDWETTHDIFEEFGVSCEESSGIEILFAVYEHEGYEGAAFVLFRRRDLTNELFSVEARHCSCYGLKGQWSAVLCTIKSLALEMENGSLGEIYNPGFCDKLTAVLKSLNPEE